MAQSKELYSSGTKSFMCMSGSCDYTRVARDFSFTELIMTREIDVFKCILIKYLRC